MNCGLPGGKMRRGFLGAIAPLRVSSDREKSKERSGILGGVIQDKAGLT